MAGLAAMAGTGRSFLPEFNEGSLNLAMVVLAAVMVWLHRQRKREHVGHDMGHAGGVSIKRVIVFVMIFVVVGGLVSWLVVS